MRATRTGDTATMNFIRHMAVIIGSFSSPVRPAGPHRCIGPDGAGPGQFLIDTGYNLLYSCPPEERFLEDRPREKTMPDPAQAASGRELGRRLIGAILPFCLILPLSLEAGQAGREATAFKIHEPIRVNDDLDEAALGRVAGNGPRHQYVRHAGRSVLYVGRDVPFGRPVSTTRQGIRSEPRGSTI